MAVFTRAEMEQDARTWMMFRDGPTLLFQHPANLDAALLHLQRRNYRLEIFGCGDYDRWPQLPSDVVRRFQLLKNSVVLNQDGFNKALWNLEIADQGGLVLVLNRFDEYWNRFPREAEEILDILAAHSRQQLLQGKRLLTVLQASRKEIIIRNVRPLGGTTPGCMDYWWQKWR